MQLPTTATNLVNPLAMELYADEKMRDFLFTGNLHAVETWVRDISLKIFNGVMEDLLAAASLKGEVLGLLREYLQHLDIAQAKSIQIVADGAPWIWNTMKPLLLSLGVPEGLIVETLDHAHASGYVNKIIAKLPEHTSSAQKNELLKQFLSWLWDGKSLQIVERCKALFRSPCQELQRWMNYLEKHTERTQYAHFKQNKYQYGSGIVESGIRRIINLRFKNPSTFWHKENVENLFFLRALCLSKRWDIFIQNYISIEHA